MDNNLFTYSELGQITGGRWLGPAFSNPGIIFISTDSRKDCRNSIFFAIKGETLDGHEYLEAAAANNASAICISKSRQGMKLPEKIPTLIVEDTLKAYQALARFHRKRLGLKVIALTGSSGKTSTKEILKAILVHAYGAEKIYATEGNTNNHVGVPQNLLNLRKNHEYAIIEMGTNHPGEIEVLSQLAEPDHGAIVSIGNAHIEFFGDTDGVAREKSAVFAEMSSSGMAIIPAEGPGVKALDKASSKYRTLRFGSEKAESADLTIKYLGGNMTGSGFELFWKNCELRKTVNWQLTGKHQAMNAGCAILAANALGVSPETASEALNKGVQLPGMRMRVQNRDGITWINDAYNANPESMRAGIEWFHEATSKEAVKGSRIFVVLGDMLEMGEAGPMAHEEILKFVTNHMPHAVLIVVGPIMGKASKVITSTDISMRDFPDSEEAAKYVKSKIKRGDIIFLKGSRGMKLEKIENIFQP
ncbi:MAG: UDP-N-acetylmuramoyl-tripeptide--D-alanyl-D-alanine ligase [Victivallales bacterium]